MYIRSSRCVPFKNCCSPLCPLSCLPWITLKGGACALNISFTLWDISMIFGIHIYQAKMICHMQELLPLLLPIWVIFLEWTLEWKAYALNNSNYLLDILMIFQIHICQVKTVFRLQESCSPLATLLDYLPLNQLNTFAAKRDCSRIYRSLPNATTVEI